MSKLKDTIEIFKFLKHSKKWWLIPIVVMLLVLGIVIIVVEASHLSPFIYPFI